MKKQKKKSTKYLRTTLTTCQGYFINKIKLVQSISLKGIISKNTINKIQKYILFCSIVNLISYLYNFKNSKKAFIAMLLSIDNNSKRISQIIKVHFSIIKQVNYGQAIYVVGDVSALGLWQVAKGFRLNWNEGHQWSGHIILNRKFISKVEFKYVIALWQKPDSSLSVWEQGTTNRIIPLENYRSSIVYHKWNCDKITLYLIEDHNEDGDQYFLIGNTEQLGDWKNIKQMKVKSGNEDSVGDILSSKQQSSQKLITSNANVYSYAFYCPRNIKKLHYYYIKKKGRKFERQRHPGRRINLLNIQQNKHPLCFHVDYSYGNIQIYQTCQFGKLHISQITNSLYLGAYLRTLEDFNKLKQQKIDAVLAIQTKQDYNSHDLSNSYLKLQCQQHGIKYHSYSIEDMNALDFVQKSLGAFLLLKKLVNQNHNKVYVHCSAGMYRSPQIIVIYMVLAQNYGLSEAIDLVRKKHPFARPNYIVLSQALQQIQQKLSRMIIQS